ncbi:MAG: hypothetical protein JRJ51_17825 [Deltaproteobacteria bacterium]|nr:hypothetical protein [Deltaproteobacteria bacterium]
MLPSELLHTLQYIARFYDQRKVGDLGALGFRRSTDLERLLACINRMVQMQWLVPGKSVFFDMGCADGRVNLLLGYLMKYSVGVELDEWTLDEYAPLRAHLENNLEKEPLLPLPDNISLFNGDAMDRSLHSTIKEETGIGLEDFDFFYTYLTMQEEFAELIVQRAKKDAIFMVYGLEKILPRWDGMTLLTEQPLEGILALYRKI